MTIRANVGPSDQWAPVTEPFLDHLHDRYCGWLDDLGEIHERVEALRNAVAAGWRPDEISQQNLNRLNANTRFIALHQMAVARTVLICAEFEARLFLPGDPNKRVIAAMAAVGEWRKPTAEQIAAHRRGMLEGRIPWPAGSERAMLRAVLVEMLESKKAKH